jgi:hypothetical protein
MTQDTTTVSVSLADLSLDQLVQLSQGLGRQAEKIREQRRHLNAVIAQRLAAGERNQPAAGDAAAPGALIEAKAE